MKPITRLRKLRKIEKREITKTANLQVTLDHFGLKSGDVILLEVRAVNNRPWFQVKHEHDWESSTFYDGENVESAFRMYGDLLATFKSISAAEKFQKNIPSMINTVNKYFASPERSKFQEYHNLIQKAPKFLGINDF